MLVLCKDKKPEDLLKYGFQGVIGGKNEINRYQLNTKRRKATKYGKKGDDISLLTYCLWNNRFIWERDFYSEDMQKIVYTLIKDNIIEYREPIDKEEEIAKLQAKIKQYEDKIKELKED